MPGGVVFKMILVTPKELDEIVERSVKKALLDHESERPVRIKTKAALDEIIRHRHHLRLTREG